MDTSIGISKKKDTAGAVSEALSGVSSAAGIIFLCDYSRLQEINDELYRRFPQAQILGTAGTSYYGEEISDSDILIITVIKGGAVLSAGVMKRLSTSPLSDLYCLQDSINAVSPGRDDTGCIEFCTNDEERLVSTMNILLSKMDIPLAGGTIFGTPAGKTSYVSVNGRLYADACGFMMIKNTQGKVHIFRENIYDREGGDAHVATRVNLKKKELIELDGRSAADVYSEETGVPRNKIADNVLESPLGRVVEDQVFISSQYEVTSRGSLICYKRINENDQIFFLKLQDYRAINAESIEEMRRICPKPSMIFSINCIYRYVLFQNEKYLREFLGKMSHLGPYFGYIGGGEQYNNQHVNQTMVCMMFD